MAGGKSGGVRVGVPKGGCLQLLFFYVISVLVVIGGAVILGTGLLSHLPVVGPTLGGITTSSNGAPVGVTLSSGGGGPAASGSTVGFQINSRQAASPQGGILTSWTNPPFYIKQPGDTLAGIAAAYGTTADMLRQYNPGLQDPVPDNTVIYLPPLGTWLPGTGRNSTPP
jgi:LysM repeat protein